MLTPKSLTRGPDRLSPRQGRAGISTREQITGVQYLRGIAALAVALFHSAGIFADASGGPPLGVLAYGKHGVDLFFVISGFIIAIVSLEGRQLAPAVSVRAFFVRRFTRIVPLMWIAIATFAVLRFVGQGEWDGAAYLRAALLLPGPIAPELVWTLRQELIFYVLFAVTMLAWRGLWWVLVVWLLACVLVPRDLAGPGLNDQAPAMLLMARNLGFGGGLALAVLWLRRTRGFRLRTPVDSFLLLLAATAVAMFVVVPAFRLDRGIGISLVFVPIVLAAIHLECAEGPIRRFGEMLGNASYAIYLFHLTAQLALSSIWMRLAPGTPGWIVVPVLTVVPTALGIAVHYLIERPLIAAMRSRLQPGAGAGNRR